MDHEQKPILRMVMSGGGARGVAYPGSYRAIAELGVFKSIEVIAGSSAGSVASALLAVGASPQLFRKLLFDLDMQSVLGERVGSFVSSNENGVVSLTRDGKPLLAYIRKAIAAALQEFSDAMKAQEEPLCCQAVEEVLSKAAQNLPITFGDLAILNQYYPQHFKKLVVTAVRQSDGGLQIFNCDQTKAVEIALACRASCAIPLVFEPVEITMNGVSERYVDGGVFDNIPTDYFDVDEAGQFCENTKKDQTLVFKFTSGYNHHNNVTFRTLHGSRWDDFNLEEYLKTALHASFDKTLAPGRNMPKNTEWVDVFGAALLAHLSQRLQDAAALERENVALVNQKIVELIKANQKLVQDILLKADKREKKEQNLFMMMLKQLSPDIEKTTVKDRLIYEYLLKNIANVKADYDIQKQRELAFRKVHQQYPLRTVDLKVGPVRLMNFDVANKYAKIVDTLAYLDTMVYLENHFLYDKAQFYPGVFYAEIVKNFEAIYKATLIRVEIPIESNALLNQLEKIKRDQAYHEDADDYRRLFQGIKENVNSKDYGLTAFALSQAVEFYKRQISSETLFANIAHEALIFSSRIRRLKQDEFSLQPSLHALKSAFQKQNPANALLPEKKDLVISGTKRRAMVGALNAMDRFKISYHDHNQTAVCEEFAFLLEALSEKVKDLQVRALKDKKGIQPAYRCANTLYGTLSALKDAYFVEKGITLNQFKEQCREAIKKAKPVLMKHRCSAMIHLLHRIGIFIEQLLKLNRSRLFAAPLTDSFKKITVLDECIQALEEPPRP